MPKAKGKFQEAFLVTKDSRGKEHYKCKFCSANGAKNESRMAKHYNICSARLNQSNLSQDSSNSSQHSSNLSQPLLKKNSSKKHVYQATVDGYIQTISKSDQRELESLLFNIIDNPDMKAFFEKACPLFELPNRQKISNFLLEQEYNHLKTTINTLIKKTPYTCLVSDGWSNINKESIINYMITTPKPLFFKSYPTKEESHTAENIANGIETVMQIAGINKFAAVITDNAANMRASWRLLKAKYHSKVFLGCWAHGINLWIKDITKIEWVHTIFNNSKELTIWFRRHQIPLATLHQLQEKEYGKKITLALPVDTHWGSSFYCIDSLLQTKKAMRGLLAEDHLEIDEAIRHNINNNSFWNNLQHLRNFLNPFVKFIT